MLYLRAGRFIFGFSKVDPSFTVHLTLATTPILLNPIIAAIMACIYRPKSDHEDTGKMKTDAENIELPIR